MTPRATMALICALCLSASSAFGQGYLYNVVSEPQTYLEALNTSPNVVMTAPADEMLSDAQSIPFGFEFFGQTYTEYRISDNGYITFDAAATTSMNESMILPNMDAPLNSIFAFWTGLQLAEGGQSGSNEIVTGTYGTAPDRVHIIQWTGVTPEEFSPSPLRKITFSIGLHENGKFDINFTDGRIIGGGAATCGSQDMNAEYAAVVDAPDFEFPPPATLPITYRFTTLDRDYDIAVTEFNMPQKLVASEEPRPLGAVVQNVGNNVINSLDVTLTITGSKGYSFNETRTFTDLNLASNQTWTMDEYDWKLDVPGEVLTLDVSVANINGDESLDAVAENNTMSAETFGFLDVSGTKRVLVEEFTGTWCGYCGDGALVVERILEETPSVVAVAIHAGGSSEPMMIGHGSDLSRRYGPSYPQALIDRRYFEGEEKVCISRHLWPGAVEQVMNSYTPLNVTTEHTYNADTRMLDFSATATFVDYHEPADLRLHIYLVEDNISSMTDQRYWQVNYYNADESHPHYDLGSRIPGFVHNHVLRGAPTGSGGVRIQVDGDSYDPGKSFTQEYSFQIPETMKVEDMEIVAFVTYEEGDITNHETYSSTHAPVLDPTSTDVNDLRGSETVGLMSPNPASQLAVIPVHLESTQDVRVDLYAVNGTHLRTVAQKRAFAGDHNFAVNTSVLSAGVYKLRLTVGDQVVWRDLVVAR